MIEQQVAIEQQVRLIERQARFPAISRFLHWLMAIMVLSMLLIGIGMVATESNRYHVLVSIHKPLGIAILFLVIIRFVNRLLNPPLPLPESLPPWQRRAAEGSHYLVVCADALHASNRLGYAFGGTLTGRACRPPAFAADPAAERNAVCMAETAAYSSGLSVLSHLPCPFRRRTVAWPRAPRRRVREHGVIRSELAEAAVTGPNREP